MQDNIDRLMEIIETQTSGSKKTQVYDDIRALFDFVRVRSKTNEIPPLLVEKLNSLISVFGNQYQTPVTYHRKIMVDISRNTQQNKSYETTKNEDGD